MSSQNVEIVRRFLHAFDFRGLTPDDPALGEYLDPDVQWLPAAQSLLAGNTYRGYQGVCQFWADLFSAWDEYVIEPDRFIDAGEQVVTVGTIRARTEEIEINEVWSGLFTLVEGRIVRFEGFASPDGALKAAGLQVTE